MKKFDTAVQELRYRVLKEIAKHLFEENLNENLLDIPKAIVPGPKPSMRCCIYKERAIVEERIKLALHTPREDENVIQVIPIACDECPLGGYTVSDACRGCIAHRCYNACPKKCISFDSSLRAHIDKENCLNCGLCAKNCPYSAIENRIRPCERACQQKAISPSEDGSAFINDNKCIQCGACVYTCPFGAIVDVSSIKEVIKDLKNKEDCVAVVAPSIGGNFAGYKTGQIVSAIKALGFKNVVEAGLGADIVAIEESKELKEKGLLLSSCCPSFVNFVNKYYPTLSDKVSKTLSPMASISKLIKENEPNAKVIFIGPCTSKKDEIKRDNVKDYVDIVITFEELQALIDAKNIDISKLEVSEMDNASQFGRGFAQCGGLASAVKEALKERGSKFEVRALSCDGIVECKKALQNLANGDNTYNFIEGMACVGGCIGGPCNLTHEIKDKINVNKFSKEGKVSINEALKGSKIIK